ncbi:hypothetical protein DPMN_090472 [Dreissena polymorpha]|uniref:Uncharacterized protein n=1 Tax=Dreissena polymorpha TaxID=45954 RepID=A0A9D4KXS3_DREPO|nr:hypothetical protein DPMN_090472 [Dreissena polymorpha]
MNYSPFTVRLTVKTCCILHILMRIRYPTMQNALVDHDDRRGDMVPGEWRRGRNLEDTRNVNTRGHNTYSNKTRQDREKHSEALGQLSSGICAIARQDGATLEIEIKCNIFVE